MKTIIFFVGIFIAVAYSGPMGGMEHWDSMGGMGPQGSMGGMGPRGPMANLTQEQRQQLFSIMRNDNQTKAQMEQQLQQFVSTLPADAQQSINNMISAMKNMQMTAPTGLSTAAQNLFDQQQAIMNNSSLTIAQQKQQMKQLMQDADPQAKSELMQALHQQMQQNAQNFRNNSSF